MFSSPRTPSTNVAPGPMVRGRVPPRAGPVQYAYHRDYKLQRPWLPPLPRWGGGPGGVRRPRPAGAAAPGRCLPSCHGGAGPLRAGAARWTARTATPTVQRTATGGRASDVFEVVPGLERKGGTSDDSALPKIAREWFRGAKGYTG